MNRRHPGFHGPADAGRTTIQPANPAPRSTRWAPSTWLLSLLLLAGCLDAVGPSGQPNAAPDAQHLLVPATGEYTHIAATGTYTCAVRTDGVVNCWGSDVAGAAPASRSAAAAGYTAVAVNNAHSCGLRGDGVVECWGSNNFGEAPPIVTPPGDTEYVGIALGQFFSCALRDDGAVDCWGWDLSNTVGTRTSATGTAFTQVSAGSYWACGLSDTGVIECWGETISPTDVPPDEFHATSGSFGAVYGAGLATCGIRTDGVLECDETVPGYAGTPLVHFASISFESQAHWCGVRTDGVVVCGGDDDIGEAPATRTAAVGSFTQVAVGTSHSCALRTDGRIECWGASSRGAYDRVLPEATFHAPSSVIVGQSIDLSMSGANIPGYPAATSFTFAFDCGTGFGTPGSTAAASCPTSATGSRTVGGRVIDAAGDFSTYSAVVAILTPEEGAIDLDGQVDDAVLSPDLRKALRSKLKAALSAIERGKTAAACAALQDFINQVNAQRGKAIPEATADAWIETAIQIRNAIGC